ncbi:MAG: class I SAM-dependent methyltransferase [Elusimicrobia bacterium]|nr:class I SAM-dependent methyltransferase [Elusimicrobiota bacterium]
MGKELESVFRRIEPTGRVLDVGCLGFGKLALAKSLGLTELRHFGVDYAEASEVPAGFTFKHCDLNAGPIPFDDDMFDLVVATHVMEHVKDPLAFFGECVRVCRPGGFLYCETPSERSLWLPGMPFEHEKFLSTSFFDDPTHVFRPWTPQSLYRLTRYYGCEPLEVGYGISWKQRLAFPVTLLYSLIARDGVVLQRACWETFGWASFVVLRKPPELKGRPSFRYYMTPQQQKWIGFRRLFRKLVPWPGRSA